MITSRDDPIEVDLLKKLNNNETVLKYTTTKYKYQNVKCQNNFNIRKC